MLSYWKDGNYLQDGYASMSSIVLNNSYSHSKHLNLHLHSITKTIPSTLTYKSPCINYFPTLSKLSKTRLGSDTSANTK